MSQTGIIGIIGGSGFYNMAGISDVREVEVETPFGKPSDPVRLGKLGGRDVAFIARHGRGHRYNPTNVPARANIFALKTLGVTHLISVSAVGSMKEEIEPLHMVVPNQLYDRTVPWCTLPSLSRTATTCASRSRRLPRAWARPSTVAEPISASRVRSSPRRPSRLSTEVGAYRSSA